MSISDENRERFYIVLANIPSGKVLSYGQLAELSGNPRKARWAGQMLSKLPHNSSLPWHRVVNAKGHISFPQGSDAYEHQRSLLENEGIEFSIEGNIDLKRFGLF